MPEEVGSNNIGSSVEETIASNAIITLAQSRVYIAKKEGDTAHDIFIQSLINIASSSIEKFIQGPVVLQEFKEQIYDGNGKDFLYVRDCPIVSLLNGAASDVQYRADPKETWQTLEPEVSYILVKSQKPYLIKLYANYFPSGHQNIRVSYKAGYANVPGDITRVCLEMVAEMYKESNRGDGRLGVQSKSNSGGSASGSDSFVDLMDRHRKILIKYRWILP